MKCRKLVAVLSLASILSLLGVTVLATAASALVGTINIEPTTGPVETRIVITGSDFTANQGYTVKFGTTTVKTGLTDAVGRLSTAFNVPALARGQYPITVTTAAPDTSNTEYFTITPEIKLGTNTARVGDQVTVSGTGFRASSTVTFYFDSTSSGTVISDSSGSFNNATFTVPASAKGNHVVTGRDSLGSSLGVTFTMTQSLTITPASGVPGERLTVTGRGFAANSTVSLELDEEPLATTANTDGSGSFTNNNFVIPPLEYGKHTLQAKDASGNGAGVEFSVGQKATIAPTSGTAGTEVTIAGNGFRAGKSMVVKYNNLTVTTTPLVITTDERGSFTGSFSVPAGLTGTYTVELSDGIYSATVNFQAVFETTFNRTTSDASPGYVGMELTIDGLGFKPNTKITISRDSTPVALATATTDEVGVFTATFVMPPTKGGRHVITVTDGTNSKQFNFVMESEAPGIPEPLLPQTNAKAKRPVHFDWKDISDPSGVTYILQVTTDDEFSDIVLEKEGLTQSEYTLAEGEDLESVVKQKPYYWRIKAIDNASNESDWSEIGSFYVGFVLTLPNGDTQLNLSAWVVYTIFGAILAIIGLSFWLGRRSLRRYL